MNTILVAVGSGIVAFIIALIVSYILPREKVRAANQLLNQQEQELQLHIKDLEKEYLKKEKELNIEYQTKYNELEQINNELEVEKQNTLNQIQTDKNNWEKEKAQELLDFTKHTKELEVEVRGLEERRDNIIRTLENEAKESGEIFKTQQIQIANEQIEKAKMELQAEYEKASEQAKQTYLDTLSDMVADIMSEYGIKSQELAEVLAKLEEAQSKADAAIKVNKRAEMDRQQKDFYRLQLSYEDLDEIKRLREVEPFLRDKEPLNKVIYKVYYEKPYTDLVGRIFGQRKPSGIYKITNLDNGKCYIGQATNIPERWRQHIKRGVGAEPVTQNKLYPAMKQEGVENFMFEVVEECGSADLTPREKYWTDFYQAQSYGYTVKKG